MVAEPPSRLRLVAHRRLVGPAVFMIEVRDMLGYRSVTTTERYAHLSESALQQAARKTDLRSRSQLDDEIATMHGARHGSRRRRDYRWGTK